MSKALTGTSLPDTSTDQLPTDPIPQTDASTSGASARSAWRFDTKKLRSSYDPVDHQYATAVPIYATTSYELGDTARAQRLFRAEELGNLYSRVGNPTVGVFEQRIADLDGGSGGIAVASGMAAITYALLNIANIGDHILSSPYLYGGTVDAFKKVFPRLGIEIDYAANLTDFAALEAQITEQTRAIFIESISNPLGIVADIEALADIAHRHGIPLVVDNTFATPYLIRPIEYGADIVIYSATKGISGHGAIIAGVIVESGGFDWANGKFPQFTETHYTLRDRSERERSFAEVFGPQAFTSRVRLLWLNYTGATLSPFDAYLALIGLETLSERLDKQLANTRTVVDWLLQNEHVEWVKWSSLPSSDNYELARHYTPKGAGTIFSFGFKGTEEQYSSFIEATRLFSYLVNVGDAKSLITDTPRTTHSELTPAEQEFALIEPNLIRLSIGLEDPQDLIDDLDQAFRKAFADSHATPATPAVSAGVTEAEVTPRESAQS